MGTRILLMTHKPRSGHDPNKYHNHNRVALNPYMANLGRMIAMAREAGAWAVLVIPPLLPDLVPDREGRVHQQLPYRIRSESATQPHRRVLKTREDEFKRGERKTYVNEDYRSAMALTT